MVTSVSFAFWFSLVFTYIEIDICLLQPTVLTFFSFHKFIFSFFYLFLLYSCDLYCHLGLTRFA